MNNTITYIIYLLVGFVLTVLVGKNLYKNGFPLILNLFENQVFATTTNHLLLTGYYLVNLGYIAITITSFPEITNSIEMVEVLSLKLGIIAFVLGLLHFNNIIVLIKKFLC